MEAVEASNQSFTVVNIINNKWGVWTGGRVRQLINLMSVSMLATGM